MAKRLRLVICLILSCNILVKAATNPDKIIDSAIHTVLVHPLGNMLALPVISLNGSTPLEISFDDFKAQYQNYYYAVELVNADWSSVQLNPFDYLQGFNQNRITNFSISSISLKSYYHYKFNFPNQNCRPTKSGNYIVKVYKDGNPNDVIFTRRFFVVDDQVSIGATVQEPFDAAISRTHQKIQINIDTKKLTYFQPNQLLVKVIQNTRYNDGIQLSTPTFIRGNMMEYNNENDLIFPSGKEARWLDLQSLRIVSDRISRFESIQKGTIVHLKPDVSRQSIPYFIFKDLNGNFIISNTESIESENQNDYAQVQFTYIPPNHLPYIGQRLFLSGALTNNILDNTSEMVFNAKAGVYQKSVLLKQGYYSYNYILRDIAENDPLQDFSETEGDHWETENDYSIFVYYRPPGARHDHLIGVRSVNSKQGW